MAVLTSVCPSEIARIARAEVAADEAVIAPATDAVTSARVEWAHQFSALERASRKLMDKGAMVNASHAAFVEPPEQRLREARDLLRGARVVAVKANELAAEDPRECHGAPDDVRAARATLRFAAERYVRDIAAVRDLDFTYTGYPLHRVVDAVNAAAAGREPSLNFEDWAAVRFGGTHR